MNQPPRRVRVTSPRTSAGAARQRPAPLTSEIDRRTSLGSVYLGSLLRAQLRLAGGVLGTVLLVTGALPLLFAWLPGLSRVIVLGVPLPWVVLAFAAYPGFVVAGWFFVRRAEANEATFTSLVHPEDEA
ncbi:hypothetical protein [Nocardioides marmoribigeumensis]|uniref:DUF485 domain-containing protein n=1 Tax=Nocardioides marmoribigeumensis TaxID=433649 RepID=A0ABU2BWS8_9ACTN|nr:hypothetical protein [Nocardioides marmoribigeumensis]MDR7362819.1 hypothetical protein [Nocardioides marmoribigeumensis]